MINNLNKGRAESEMLKHEQELIAKGKAKLQERLRKEKEMEPKMETYDNKKFGDIIWTEFMIVVPTEEDKISLELAFEHLHNTDCDTNFVPVNQLVHQYLSLRNDGKKNNIIVSPELYKITKKK